MKNLTLRRIGQWILVAIVLYFWGQLIFLGETLFNFEACCPFGGLQAITTFFTNGALSCSMGTIQVAMGVMLAIATIFISKLFCGHVCPIGTVSEGLWRLGKRMKLPKFEMGSIADALLRSLKYVLLFITFYFTLQSNDLFCKQYDPFFATVTLFGTDVTSWMAIISISVLVLGAVFLRHFWCRYMCPLGALSNAFKYIYVFLVFAIVLIVLHEAEVNINSTWVLGIIMVTAYVLELVGLHRRAGLQVFRVTRNTDLCINCGLCDKNCPQGIKVSQMKTVNHPDCNMCMECMGNCPGEEAIGINGSTKFRWLPTLMTVVLVMAGFILGTNTSIPTVDMEWGTEEGLKNSEIFEMSGLKNVKCYGSSMTFVGQMKKVPGITGAATYMRDHRVVLKYDTTKISENQVRRALFSPQYMDIHQPENEAEVHITDLYIENFFDQLDVVFLANTVKNIDGFYSFKTHYGNPIRVRCYTDGTVSSDSLKMMIEESNLIYSTPEESFSSKDLYTVSKIAENDTTMSGLYLKSRTFPAFKRAFNNRSKYSNDQLVSLVFPISYYPKNTQMMQYVMNYLGKSDEYIVGLVSQYTKNGPIAVVFYVKDQTTPEKVADLMMDKKISIEYSNGVKEEINNPYTFELPKSLAGNENSDKNSSN